MPLLENLPDNMELIRLCDIMPLSFTLIHASLISSNVLYIVSREQGMRQTACLVFNQIMVEGYAASFSCTAVTVVQASDSMTASI